MKKHNRRVLVVLIAGVAITSVALAQTPRDLLEEGAAVLKKEGMGGIDRGLGLLDRAMAQDPALETAYVLAARACLFRFELSKEKDKQWLERGLGYADRLLEKMPDHAEGHVVRAQILLDQGAVHEAGLSLKKALGADPANLLANITYVAYLAKATDANAALAFARESLAKFPGKEQTLARTYADLFRQTGHPQEAEKLLEDMTPAAEVPAK